eukprot:CAMPEP_0194543252 /NCGR_PEP_ID=MMETSP0253-20130528/85473_1 /TAXON_ID=2966 /ORGANISM="Noctiluca scintillans" /LENGTH=210 /DNA_ID=CAMNT_0039389993 /DNA_START=623 /DNA_END=1252 /DNA_ORIENTATION=+
MATSSQQIAQSTSTDDTVSNNSVASSAVTQCTTTLCPSRAMRPLATTSSARLAQQKSLVHDPVKFAFTHLAETLQKMRAPSYTTPSTVTRFVVSTAPGVRVLRVIAHGNAVRRRTSSFLAGVLCGTFELAITETFDTALGLRDLPAWRRRAPPCLTATCTTRAEARPSRVCDVLGSRASVRGTLRQEGISTTGRFGDTGIVLLTVGPAKN